MNTTVVIIGAGQAGLAMSRCLTDQSIEHVLLEKGSIAHSWREERWDSLRLLTPNWLSRLPEFSYTGNDSDGYMTASNVVQYLQAYKRSFDAPVIENTAVTSVVGHGNGFLVETDQGPWHSRAVVVASGAASSPRIPNLSKNLPFSIRQIAPIDYRNPYQIEQGGVLIVGASASGIQIAEELARAGTDVTLAVGEHVRVPRTYRGMDIHWWMSSLGILDERYDEVDDLTRARRVSSLQLIGSPGKRDLDINAVTRLGVEVVGRLVAAPPNRLQFSGSLPNAVASADQKQNRLLAAIDDYARANGLDSELSPPHHPEPTTLAAPRTEMEISRFRTVIWATGYKPEYPWLSGHLLDAKGAIRHEGGVMVQPGMYVVGLLFMRRRKSNFIDGVGPDAVDLSRHLLNYLDRVAARS